MTLWAGFRQQHSASDDTKSARSYPHYKYKNLSIEMDAGLVIKENG